MRSGWLTEGNEKLSLMRGSLLVAVNGDYAQQETVLREGDEVTFLLR